jgi:hypothetical protein
MKLPTLQHEYVLLWQKRGEEIFAVFKTLIQSDNQRTKNTWNAVLRNVLVQLRGCAKLEDLYRAVSRGAPENVAANPTWRVKVRQALQLGESFTSQERGSGNRLKSSRDREG